MVDKNLFLYDLAVVAIMKNEERYVKEWMDYHLLAGVDHFYIYDNDSTPEFKNILQPYIDKNIVTRIPFSIWQSGVPAYNDATQKFKFFCRYIAYLDSDEFIFPKENKSIVETMDEIFSVNPTAGGLLVNWQCFGTNGQEKADYSRGVLERFTRRAETSWFMPPDKERTYWLGNIHIKTIANPRKIYFFRSPHFADFFASINATDENGKPVSSSSAFKFPITANKIVINHYLTKSREEFFERRPASKRADVNPYFDLDDRNEVFDDGILKYRDARKAALIGKGGGIDALFARKQINPQRLFNALAQNLVTTTVATIPRNFYEGKVENFLTCLHLSGYLRGKLFDDDGAKNFEELSLNALYKSMVVGSSIADILLLIDELPKILELNYPAVKKIREACVQIIPQIMTTYRLNNHWQGFTELNYILRLLKAKT